MAYSVNATLDGCYPGTSILFNKLNIRNQQQLDENEMLITSVKAAQYELAPFEGNPDFIYLKKLHRYLFGDIYTWAGNIRSVNLSKLHTSFCPSDSIGDLAERIFKRVSEYDYFRNLSVHDFATEAADLYQSINYLHPFREGNGRTQRLFFRYLARHAGHQIDFSAVDTDTLMLATIHAASGLMDGLIEVFSIITTWPKIILTDFSVHQEERG